MSNLGLVADNEDVLLQHDDIRIEIGDKGNILNGDGSFMITSKKAIWIGKKDDNNEENRKCNNFSVLHNDIVMHALCKESSTPHVFCQIDNSNGNCIGIDINIDMFDLYIYDISKDSDKNTISSNIYDALSQGQSLNPPEKEFGFDSDDSQNGTMIHSGNLDQFDQIVNNNGNSNDDDNKMNDLMAHLDSILKVPPEFEKENRDVNVNVNENRNGNDNINGYFDNLANDLQEMTQNDDDNWIPPSAINTSTNENELKANENSYFYDNDDDDDDDPNDNEDGNDMKEDNNDGNDINDYLVDFENDIQDVFDDMGNDIKDGYESHQFSDASDDETIDQFPHINAKNCLTSLNAKETNIQNEDDMVIVD